MRCMVLNASYEFLTIQEHWIDALTLVFQGKATPLSSYDDEVRSASASFKLPAVVVMRHQVSTRRKRKLFDAPSRRAVLIRDGFRCQYCDARLTMATGTRDRVIPRCKGGADVLTNVVAACTTCNSRKADLTPEQAGMTLKSQPRRLSEEEKIQCLLKTVRSKERQAWMTCLKDHGIALWAA